MIKGSLLLSAPIVKHFHSKKTATMMIKGSLFLSAPIVKHFHSKKTKSRFGPKFDGLGG